MSGRELNIARFAGTERSVFAPFALTEISTLIRDCRSAWLFALGAEDIGPSLVPFAGIYDRHGRLLELIGRMAAANPLSEALARDPHGLILFDGLDVRPSGKLSLTIHADIWLEDLLPGAEANKPMREIVLGARVSRIRADHHLL